MADDAGDKKHEPTEYRRQKAREKGQVARSTDLGSALVLIGAVVLLSWAGPALLDGIAGIMTGCLTQDYFKDLDSHSASALLAASAGDLLTRLLPLMLGICGIILVNNWFQIGFLFLPDKLTFDIKRIDPLKGFKRLFELPNFARLGFGLLKIALVTAVIILGLWARWDLIIGAQALSTGQIGGLVWDTTMDLCLRTGIVLLLLAICDYGFQRWKTEQDLRMTDQEVREEMKMMNGDPHVAQKRRQIQRQMAMGQLAAAIPEADVVITNPTELAIAIKFDAETMVAPLVVAKGSGHLAARIRKMALEAGVPVVERKPLARALFKIVEVGDTIPVDQYAAVAEVLRYVYELQGKKIPTVDSRNAA